MCHTGLVVRVGIEARLRQPQRQCFWRIDECEVFGSGVAGFQVRRLAQTVDGYPATFNLPGSGCHDLPGRTVGEQQYNAGIIVEGIKREIDKNFSLIDCLCFQTLVSVTLGLEKFIDFIDINFRQISKILRVEILSGKVFRTGDAFGPFAIDCLTADHHFLVVTSAIHPRDHCLKVQTEGRVGGLTRLYRNNKFIAIDSEIPNAPLI